MIGTQIGKYEILAEIGRGGMGIVYHGVQKSLNRSVAIKVLPPELANDSKSVQRFIQEANLIAKLDHENIVKIYDIEEKDSHYYIIMEYLHGTSLENIIKNPSLRVSRDELVGYIIQVCEAMHSAHQTGVIHRDVKSANIFITTNGKAKLMDFGISKMIYEKKMTTSGGALGTPSYMSPEQAKGEALDHFSDIYSLGVVLYECLTAKLPFEGEDMFSVALKHISDKPVPPSSVNSSIEPYLSDACLKALNKDKFSRFQTCAEMGEALSGREKEEVIVIKSDNKINNILSKITNEKIFLPVLAIVSVLAFYFAFQQYKSSKFLIDGNSRDKIEIKEMKTSSKLSTTVLLNNFEVALKNNKIEKASAIMNLLKRKHFDKDKVRVMENQLLHIKEKWQKKKELKYLIEIDKLDEALRLSLNLFFLYPEDEYFKSHFKIVQSKLKNSEKEDELLTELIGLRLNGDNDELLKMSLYYVDQYPDNKIGKDFVSYAKEQLHLNEERVQVESAIEKASFFKESNNFKQALEIIVSALEIDSGNVSLLIEEASIMQEICRRKLKNNTLLKDKDIYDLLRKMSLAFSKKDLDLYLNLLDSSKKDFYSSEKKSAEDLFEFTDDIFNSLEVIDCKVKGNNAQVSITWDVRAVFKDREGLFSIFKNKGYIDIKKKDSNWVISDFVWIK